MANPSQTSVDAVQQAYIAFYGRPADPIGLAYWANQLDANGGNLSSIIDAFGNSTESQALYGNQSPASQINAIYEQLFNRPADPTGLQYYADLLQNHKATAASLALQILDGATTGNDAQMIANKLAVAKAFTTEVAANTTDILAYQGNDSAAAVRALLSTVTYDSSTVTTAENDFGTCLTNLEHNAPGQTFTLTTGVDHVIGTAGNDIVNATPVTLNAFDSIDGGTGINTLNVVDQGGDISNVVPVGASIQNIQVLNLAAEGSIGDAATPTVVDTTGISSLTNVNANAGAAIDVQVADNVDVTAQTAGGEVDIHGGASATVIHSSALDTDATNVTGNAVTSVSVSGGGAVNVTGTSVANVSVANVAADITVLNGTVDHAESFTLNNVTGGVLVKDVAATTVSVAATGQASDVALVATDATTINLSGDAALVLEATGQDVSALTQLNISGAGGVTAVVSGATNLTDVNASSSVGNNHITLDATAATFEGGAGNDSVTIAAAPTKAIDGGAGNNELVWNAATDYTASTHVTNFQILGAGTAATGNLDATGFSTVHIGGATAGAIDFTNVAAGTNLVIDGASGNNILYTLHNATGTSDSVNVTIGNSSTHGLDLTHATTGTSTLDLSGIENVNVSSLGQGLSTDLGNTVELTDAAAKSLTITGNEHLELYSSAATALTNVDASATTHGVNLSGLEVSANGATITGGTGADVLVGGAGNDTIVGGGGADVITGGVGADNITVSGHTSTIVEGANDSGVNSATTTQTSVITTSFDVIHGAVAGDKIDLSAMTTTNGVAAANNLAGVAGTVEITHGDYSNGTFTFDTKGADTIVTFDNGTHFESIVLVGTNVDVAHTTISSGVVTLA